MKTYINNIVSFAAVLLIGLGNPQFIFAESRGWVDEIMPEGMARGESRGEYVWVNSGEVMVYIPDGATLMPPMTLSARDEYVNVPAFYISKYEVTVGSYRKFTQKTGYRTEAERRGKAFIYDLSKGEIETRGINFKNPGFPQNERHPVVFVTWQDAKTYCNWAGGKLPTISQWIKAALWDEENNALRNRPWQKLSGPNDLLTCSPYLKAREPLPRSPLNFDKANARDFAFGRAVGVAHGEMMPCNDQYVYTAPVGSYPNGQSYYHVHDMIGNVSELFEERVPPCWLGPPETWAIGGSWLDIIIFHGLYPLPPTRPANPGGWAYVGFRMAIPSPKK